MDSEVGLDEVARSDDSGALVVDVREPSEFVTGHLPGARLIPSGQVRERLYELPRGATVYLVCADGARSQALVPFLRATGYDAYSLAGGMRAWERAGRPVVTPLEP